MSDKIIVENICNHRRDGHLPTIVRFQNGSLGGVSEDNAKYSVIEHKKGKSKRALVVAGSTQNVYTGDLQDTTEYNSYICVRNKNTNKVQIVPVQQALLSNHIYEQLAKQQELNKKPLFDKQHANKKLLKEFGGRKDLRYADNREQMMVHVDVLRQDLDATVEESTRNDNDDNDETLRDVLGSNAEYLATIVPKYDKEATTVSEVYDVENVVPLNLLERLDEEAKVVYATPLETLPIESEYLRECLKRIQAKELAAKQDFRDIKLIIYMDALQSLISLRKREMKSVEFSRITEKVENDIRYRFADPHVAKSCTRTTFSSEKALTHFIVLALLISGKYEVDVNTLSRTLRTSKQRIITYAHIVNAQLKPRSDMLTLRLPSTVKPLARRRFQTKK